MATAQEIRAAALATQAATKPAARVFYHQIPGSRFCLQRSPGLVEDFFFAGGELETTDVDLIAALEAVADRSGSFISSDKARAAALTQDQQMARDDAREAAEIAANKMIAAGERLA